jgi:hypothetical protein
MVLGKMGSVMAGERSIIIAGENYTKANGKMDNPVV